MIQLERDPHAGEALLGGLIGYRKLTVGDRDWRVVWRVIQDEAGGFLVEVAEVWAVGHRKDSQVYAEIQHRVDAVGPSPRTRALTEILALFAKQSRDLTATPEPVEPESVPRWLSEALKHVVGLDEQQISVMSLSEAETVWNDHITGPGAST